MHLPVTITATIRAQKWVPSGALASKAINLKVMAESALTLTSAKRRHILVTWEQRTALILWADLNASPDGQQRRDRSSRRVHLATNGTSERSAAQVCLINFQIQCDQSWPLLRCGWVLPKKWQLQPTDTRLQEPSWFIHLHNDRKHLSARIPERAERTNRLHWYRRMHRKSVQLRRKSGNLRQLSWGLLLRRKGRCRRRDNCCSSGCGSDQMPDGFQVLKTDLSMRRHRRVPNRSAHVQFGHI